MKAVTKKWLPFVQADMETAKVMLRQRNRNRWNNILILFHCQQAIEKLFKAIIVEKGEELLKIHNLRRLREIADVQLSDEHFELIIELNKYYLESRYPDLIYKALPDSASVTAQRVFKQTDTLHIWLLNYLKKL